MNVSADSKFKIFLTAPIQMISDNYFKETHSETQPNMCTQAHASKLSARVLL